MRLRTSKHVQFCDRGQRGKKQKLKYGHILPKVTIFYPWKQLSVDLIGPYTNEAKGGFKLNFICLTMIDPATSWFEIAELSTPLCTAISLVHFTPNAYLIPRKNIAKLTVLPTNS